jgi:hypothetical protein
MNAEIKVQTTRLSNAVIIAMQRQCMGTRVEGGGGKSRMRTHSHQKLFQSVRIYLLDQCFGSPISLMLRISFLWKYREYNE